MQYCPLTSSIFHLLLLTSLAWSQTLTGTYNCPGVFYVDSHSASSCCVGATQASIYMSTCPGWPICTGKATTTLHKLAMSCATDIAYTDSNYEQLVSSASASLIASGGNFQTTITDWQIAEGGSVPTGGASNTAGGASNTAGGASNTAASASNSAGVSGAPATSGTGGALGNGASVYTVLASVGTSVLFLVCSLF